MSLQRFTSSLALATVLALGFGALAQAQPHGHRHNGPPAHAHGHKHDTGKHGARSPSHGKHAHRPVPPPKVRHHHRGAGPDHRWFKGSRIPPQYRGSRYVVNDWRGHRLHQPPRGYQWVQYRGDYMLVAITSGVIAQLLIQGMR